MRKLGIAAVIAGLLVGAILAGLMLVTGKAEAQVVGEDTVADPAVLKDTNWTLTAWSDAAPLPGVPITLKIGDGQVSGVSACNNYFGPVTLTGASFEVSPLATTMMLCMDTQAAEQTYLTLIQSVTAWERTGDVLVLSAGTDEVLRFALDH